MDEILNLIKIGRYSYDENHDIYWNDKEFVLKAVKNNGWSSNYASRKLLNDKEFILEATKINGISLLYPSKDIKNNRNIVLEIVKNKGTDLSYANDIFFK